MNTPIRLSEIGRCLQGVIPCGLATADGNGVPNVTYVSHVQYIDDDHVAISRQFFNKTSRNLDETRLACVELYDPVDLQAYRLKLRFLRSETEGELFRKMSARIDAIASHTGMTGIFRLIGADIFEVEEAVKVDGFLAEIYTPDETEKDLCGDRNEIRGLQVVSNRINRASDLDTLIDSVLESLEEGFGFRHTMLLLHQDHDRLVTIASRGYGESGIGAEVRLGEGLIGTAAREHSAMRVSALEEGLRYGRAARRSMVSAGQVVADEIPLPGLPGVQCVLVIPLWVEEELVGVLTAESSDAYAFGEWHEAYLELVGNQIALGICRMLRSDEGDEGDGVAVSDSERLHTRDRAYRKFAFYPGDDSVFVDDDYLIRNVPGRILWKLLREWKSTGRTDFSNRELRLDPALGLPALKDNLESRLILLRKRLDEKCGNVRIVSTGRGKFSLVVDAEVDLQER